MDVAITLGWTLGSWISPKHSKILENVYSLVATFGSFLLWMVATVTTSQNSNKKKHPLEHTNGETNDFRTHGEMI